MLKKEDIIILSNPKIEILNVMASGDFRENTDLKMAADVMGNVIYEPAMFPGLIYRMEDPKAVLLLFASGKMACIGARRERQVYKGVEKIYEMLEEKKNLFYEAG